MVVNVPDGIHCHRQFHIAPGTRNVADHTATPSTLDTLDKLNSSSFGHIRPRTILTIVAQCGRVCIASASDALECMKKIGFVTERFGADPNGYSVVEAFRTHAIRWRGEVARRIKKELGKWSQIWTRGVAALGWVRGARQHRFKLIRDPSHAIRRTGEIFALHRNGPGTYRQLFLRNMQAPRAGKSCLVPIVILCGIRYGT